MVQLPGLKDHRLGQARRQVGRVQAPGQLVPQLDLARGGGGIPAGEGQVPLVCQLCLSVGECSLLFLFLPPFMSLILFRDETGWYQGGEAVSQGLTMTGQPHPHCPQAQGAGGYHFVLGRALAYGSQGYVTLSKHSFSNSPS